MQSRRSSARAEWLVCALAIAGFAAAAAGWNWFARVDQTRYDAGMRLLARPAPDNIAIVAIDQLSLDRIGLVLAEIPERAPVAGVSDLIQRVFANLLSNAVKYSPEDTDVRCSIVREGAAADRKAPDWAWYSSRARSTGWAARSTFRANQGEARASCCDSRCRRPQPGSDRAGRAQRGRAFAGA